MYWRCGYAHTSYNPPLSPFKKGGILDSPPLKKGGLGGLSVIVRSYSTRHANISAYAVFLLSLRNLPLSAHQGRGKFSFPLGERDRVRGSKLIEDAYAFRAFVLVPKRDLMCTTPGFFYVKPQVSKPYVHFSENFFSNLSTILVRSSNFL